MSGVKGRSGRRPLPLETHLLRHTFRPDRHGPRPSTEGATALQAPLPVPLVPPTLLADLGTRGRQFVTELWNEYADWSPSNIVLLREAAEVLDLLERCRRSIAAKGCLLTGQRGTPYPHPLLRVQRQARATLLALVAAMNLKDA